mgnify:FL=1
MVENTSRVGTRADTFTISDHPHTQYYEVGVPVLTTTPLGYIVDKHVEYTTLCCPDCGQEGRYIDEKEPVCEDCGIILSEDGVPRTSDGSPILTDAKSAGRVDSGSTEN